MPGATGAAGGNSTLTVTVCWVGLAAGQSLNALTIPMSAVIYPGSLPSVFAVARDGKAELRVVRLGERQGERVVVLSGVQAGDKVVTAPPRHMRTGDIVQATAPAERKP